MLMKGTPTPTSSSTSVPAYKGGFYQNSQVQLPPTPTSSTSTSTYEKTTGKDLTSSLKIPASSQKYGSLESSVPYFEFLNESRPVTPSQTTVSPNDNDEGLYLLWTQQLLRQRGFKPSPCTPDEYGRKDDEDEDDDDSSVSDMSSISSGEEDEEQEDDRNIDQYIIEQRNLFSPTYQASMISHYSTAAGTSTEEQEEENDFSNARQNPISSFFSSCFSSCL